MQKLTNKDIEAFISDSSQKYIEGVIPSIPSEWGDMTTVIEIFKKPVLQRKHKVEALYCTLTEIQASEKHIKDDAKRIWDNIVFYAFVVDNKTLYPPECSQEFTLGEKAEWKPKQQKDTLKEYILKKYRPSERSVRLFFANCSELEQQNMLRLAAHQFVTNGKCKDVVDTFIEKELLNWTTCAYWLANPDDWIKPVLQMRQYASSCDFTITDNSLMEVVQQQKTVELLCSHFETNEKYLRLRKLVILAQKYFCVTVKVKHKTPYGEEVTTVGCNAPELEDITILEQGGLYLQNGSLKAKPWKEHEKTELIPFENICEVRTPNGFEPL